MLYFEQIQKLLKSQHPESRYAAACACIRNPSVPLSFIEDVLRDETEDADIRATMAAACFERDIAVVTIRAWLSDRDSVMRTAAMYASIKRNDVPLGMIRYGLADKENSVSLVAAQACFARQDIDANTIRKWQKRERSTYRMAAVLAAFGHTDIPEDVLVEITIRGIIDNDDDIAAAARAIPKSVDPPITMTVAFAMIKSKNPLERRCGIELFPTVKDVSADVLMALLMDEDESVRYATSRLFVEDLANFIQTKGGNIE